MKIITVLFFLFSLALSCKSQNSSPPFIGKWTITAVVADYTYYNMKNDSLVIPKHKEAEYSHQSKKEKLKQQLRWMYKSYTVEITADGKFNFSTDIEELNMKGTYKDFPGKNFFQVTSKDDKGQKMIDTMWYHIKNGLLHLKSKAENPDFVFIYHRVGN